MEERENRGAWARVGTPEEVGPRIAGSRAFFDCRPALAALGADEYADLAALRLAAYEAGEGDDAAAGPVGGGSTEGSGEGSGEGDGAAAFLPVVLTDPALLGGAMFVLVPPGEHVLPAAAFVEPRYWVALAGRERPVLRVVADERWDFVNPADGRTRRLPVVPIHGNRFAGLSLRADTPTLLETAIGEQAGESLSNHASACDFSETLEMFDAGRGRLWLDRAWARDAMGETAAGPDAVMRTLDTLEDATQRAVDAVFAPLVRAGDAIDRLLGLGRHAR